MNKWKKRASIIGEIIGSIICLLLSTFIKRNEYFIAFGSWCGELYSDNSKYLAEYIRENYPQYKIFWVGKKSIKDHLPKDYIFVELDKLSSALKLLSCKTFFFTQMHRPDISKYNVYRGASLCLLDHGNALKKWAIDATGYNGYLEYDNFSICKKIYTNIVGENHPYQYITVSSYKTALAYSTALAYRMDSSSKIIETGLPRNDVFANIDPNQIAHTKEKYAKRLGFSADKHIILYVPTFRRKTEKVESFVIRDKDEIEKLEMLLSKTNSILLEKNHFAANKFDVNKHIGKSKSILKITIPVDVQEILEFTDILITDYSSVVFDYLSLDRPTIFYVYDYDEYKNVDSGLYYDIDEYASGAICNTFDEVYNELVELLCKKNDNYIEKRGEVKKELCTFDDGYASERITKIVLLHNCSGNNNK